MLVPPSLLLRERAEIPPAGSRPTVPHHDPPIPILQIQRHAFRSQAGLPEPPPHHDARFLHQGSLQSFRRGS